MWDTANWKLIYVLSQKGLIGDLVFSHDSKTLIVVGEGYPDAGLQQSLSVYKSADWKLYHSLLLPDEDIATHPLSFSPRDEVLAVGRTLYGVKDWKVLRRLAVKGSLFSASFSSDDKTLALGGWDNFVELWNWTTGKKIRTIQPAANTADFATVRFSPDGKLLSISNSSNATAKMWDTVTWQPVFSLNVGEGVHAVAFSPDNAKIATVSNSFTKLWNRGYRKALAYLQRKR